MHNSIACDACPPAHQTPKARAMPRHIDEIHPLQIPGPAPSHISEFTRGSSPTQPWSHDVYVMKALTRA